VIATVFMQKNRSIFIVLIGDLSTLIKPIKCRDRNYHFRIL